MKIHQIIGTEQIDPRLLIETSEQAIQSLAHRLVETRKLPSEYEADAILSLLKRESSEATNIGNGVAIPHAKVPFVKEFVGALGILEKPIPYGGPTGDPVLVIFLLLSPDWDDEGHLQLMAEISRLASDATLPTRLSSIRVAENIHQRIKG